jgi:hypothetical protein
MASDPKGLDRLLRQVGALSKLQLDVTGAQLNAGSDDLARKVAAACAVPQIAAHITSEKVDSGVKGEAGLVYHVKAVTSGKLWNAYNPRWEEFGVKPHDIPRKGGGIEHHPGAKARPFFWPTVRAWRKPNHRRIVVAANKAAKAAAAVR